MADSAKRIEVARTILEDWDQNDWMGSSEIEEAEDNRFAIVIEREGDSWVHFADSDKEIAQHYLGCYTGTEGYDEWIEGVYDLDNDGAPYPHTAITTVTVNGAVATDQPEPQEEDNTNV